MGRIIAIVSSKGGVGKTTITLNLASILSNFFKKSVTIVDCNLHTPHIGSYIGIFTPIYTLNDVLRGETSIEDALHFHPLGFNLILASPSAEDLKGVDISKLKINLENLRGSFDFIILDSAPGVGREVWATLRASDEVIFVSLPLIPHLLDVLKAYEIAKEVGAKPLGLILNMVHKEPFELEREEVERFVGLKVLTEIPYSKKVNQSISLNIPFVHLYQKSIFTKNLIKVCSFLTNESFSQPGLFQRFLNFFKLKKFKE
jgi:MinD-like ATPase involved in chromosome partitioning or flagellar assembly